MAVLGETICVELSILVFEDLKFEVDEEFFMVTQFVSSRQRFLRLYT